MDKLTIVKEGKRVDELEDGDSYQKLQEAQDRTQAIHGIKRGLESMKRNAGKSAEKFFRDFFAEKDISQQE